MQQMMIDATGRPFSDYMVEAVFKPLGMSSSTFVQPLPEAWARRAATGFASASRPPVEGRWRILPESAAGGLWTTAGDLARFLIGIQQALAGTSTPVISQSMARQMVTAQKNDAALGFFVGGSPHRFGHNGTNRGFHAVTVAFSDSGEGAVILMNANTDIEPLKDILIEAVGTQYKWSGYLSARQTPNHAMERTADRCARHF